ncbi:MAG: hypothetical protein ACREJ2_16355 [Planctomycetota bacterium]
MNPKFLIAPILTGAIVAIAMALYIKTLKTNMKDQDKDVSTATTARDAALGKIKAAEDAVAKEKAAAAEAAAGMTKENTTLSDQLAAAKKELDATNRMVTDDQAQIKTLKESSAQTVRHAADLDGKLAEAQKELADAKAAHAQAEENIKTVQAELDAAKQQDAKTLEPGYLAAEYKVNATLVRTQVAALVKEVPDLAGKPGTAGGGDGDALRAAMGLRMATLLINAEFQYNADSGDEKKDVQTWTTGAVVVGMDGNQVYLFATPPPHAADLAAAKNSLTKNCTLDFGVLPPGWSGAQTTIPAQFLGVIQLPGDSHVPNGFNVAVFAAPLANWPDAQAKPLPLLPAPTVQECQQWTVNGDLDFVYSRGVPSGTASGAVRMETPVHLNGNVVTLTLPAQATGYELGLFGSIKAPADRSVLGIFYPDDNRVVWFSDLYNGAQALPAALPKRNDAAKNWVGADWVVTVHDSKSAPPAQATLTDFVAFVAER